MNSKQILHGLYVTVGTAIVGALEPLLQSGTLPTSKQILAAAIIGLGAGLVYLSKLPVIGSSQAAIPENTVTHPVADASTVPSPTITTTPDAK